MRCLLYKAYDKFKQSWLASKLIFKGDRFQHFEEITLCGTIVGRDEQSTDGDNSFNMNVDGAPWHCEVTPCAPPELVAIAKTLQAWMLVRVSGTRTWDPTHLGQPGHIEIHPVTKIEVLHESSNPA